RKRSSQGACPCLRALRSAPWDWLMKRPGELERAHTVLKALQLAPIARRETLAGQVQQLSRGQVQQHGPRRRKLVERLHPAAGDHLAPERLQVSHERCRELLRPSGGKWPAAGMRGHRQWQGWSRGRELLQRQEGGLGQAGAECPSVVGWGTSAGQRGCRTQGL